MIDMQKFLEQFKKEYEFMYENDDNVVGYEDALEYGLSLLRDKNPIVYDFIAYRNDLIVSNREVAALGFAYNELIN